jgi:nickel transport protein
MTAVGRSTVLFVILLSLALYPDTCSAHKVSLFAYQEGGIVYTESYFVDGTPCRKGKITARDDRGAIVAEGLTDDEGRFSFPYGLSGNLGIVLRASAGHGSEFILTADEDDNFAGYPEGGGAFGGTSQEVTVKDEGAVLNEATVKKIVEDRIGPIRESLMEIRRKQEKPTLGKILGGLGWIAGIAGAYLWGVAKRRNKT